MAERYQAICEQLQDPVLPMHKRQILQAARLMLRDFMENKARDVRRAQLGKE